MVMPAWPPTTGMCTDEGSAPAMAPMKACERTTSSLVTPISFAALKVPAPSQRVTSLSGPGTVLEVLSTWVPRWVGWISLRGVDLPSSPFGVNPVTWTLEVDFSEGGSKKLMALGLNPDIWTLDGGG